MDALDKTSAGKTALGGGGSSGGDKTQRQKIKRQVCDAVVKRLRELGHPATQNPGFETGLLGHFNKLPTRYALDVNTERAEDVITHKRLLEEAKLLDLRPVFFVRAVQLSQPNAQGMADSPTGGLNKSSSNMAPSFGSAPNISPASQLHGPSVMDDDLGEGGAGGGATNNSSGLLSSLGSGNPSGPMHEVTFSTLDRPKLLSQLSAVLADVGLNIREAHVFSTVDGYSLDVFVADGWPTEDIVELHGALLKSLEASSVSRSYSSDRPPALANQGAPPVPASSSQVGAPPSPAPPSLPLPSAFQNVHTPQTSSGPSDHVFIPSDGSDDWEIDSQQLKLHHKIASGSFGDLFRGTYCGQDVAIKILKSERLNDSLQSEFAQEVFIMRKVRHKNVVQFIGACTKPPNLSIVTEFMSGGSVYDFLHKQRGSIKLPMLLRVAIDVAKGMDFLHKNNIIHRDLKAANLLMDENEVVKVADFGVARVQSNSGIMTAETGTYRWMAPEVIEHRPYDHRADVFSYGVTLWELLTGKLPYADLTPLQAAVSVVQKGLRPPIPKGTNPRLAELMEKCWHTNPTQRPEFAEIVKILQDILKDADEEGESETRRKEKKGFFSSFTRK